MKFSEWLMENETNHYPTTPELIERQKHIWHSPFPTPSFSEVQIIPVNEIQPNSMDYYPEHVEELKILIENGKALPPILLKKRYPGQKYQIRDGTHRHLASIAAKKTHIPALIGG